MKNFTVACVLALFVVLSSCQNSEKDSNEIKYFDLQSGMNNPESMVLSDLVSDISYTPLETLDESLMGHVQTIVVADDKYLLAERSKVIKVFSLDGEYSHNIGKIGKGPGEYQESRSVSWDSEKKEVVVYNIGNTSLQFYNSAGDFQKNFKVPHDPIIIYPLQNGNFLGWEIFETKIDSLYCSVFQFDTEGLVYPFGNTKPSDAGLPNVFVLPSSFRLGKKDLYIPERSDTVFHVLDGELRPFASLGLENKMMPDDVFYNREASASEKSKYIYGLMAYELNDNEFAVEFKQGKQRYWAFCNVKTGSSKVTKIDAQGVKNDVDGGQALTYFPQAQNHDGYLYKTTSPIDMQSDLEERKDEPQAKYKEFVESLDPEGNPVIIKMKLKSKIL